MTRTSEIDQEPELSLGGQLTQWCSRWWWPRTQAKNQGVGAGVGVGGRGVIASGFNVLSWRVIVRRSRHEIQ